MHTQVTYELPYQILNVLYKMPIILRGPTGSAKN